MMKLLARSGRKRDAEERPPRHVSLPGFITDEEIGLGDVISRATSYFGVKPCAGCRRRAAALNRWLLFTRRRVFARRPVFTRRRA
jgi:hypothetical protein